MVIIMDSVLPGADGCGMVCGTGPSLGVRVGGELKRVIGGGIFSAYPGYADMVFAKASSRAKMIRMTLPSVYGAAVMAMAEAGLTCGETFRQTFLRDYAAWKR